MKARDRSVVISNHLLVVNPLTVPPAIWLRRGASVSHASPFIGAGTRLLYRRHTWRTHDDRLADSIDAQFGDR